MLMRQPLANLNVKGSVFGAFPREFTSTQREINKLRTFSSKSKLKRNFDFNHVPGGNLPSIIDVVTTHFHLSKQKASSGEGQERKEIHPS
jgi:hypothetical protein